MIRSGNEYGYGLVWVHLKAQISLDHFEVGYVNNVYFKKHSPKISAEDTSHDFF